MYKLFTIVSFVFCILCGYGQKLPNIKDLSNPIDNLDAFIKIRGSLNPKEEVVYYASGNIYAHIPEQPFKLLFKFEMYNVCRIERILPDSGYKLITKEVLLYKDPVTDTILEQWLNPYTNEKVNVVHAWNNPVNAALYYNKTYMDYTLLGNGNVCMNADLLLFYPSPLPKEKYPLNSRSNNYHGAEFFNFIGKLKNIKKRNVKNAYADLSWARYCDFLPWMRMTDKPGYLLYHSRGWKVDGGFKNLSPSLKNYILTHDQSFAHPPSKYSKPNMTSWRYFKMLEDHKKEIVQ
jgi:hypothetical protein